MYLAELLYKVKLKVNLSRPIWMQSGTLLLIRLRFSLTGVNTIGNKQSLILKKGPQDMCMVFL